LKPDNILIDHMGNARLGDFGMSRVIETDNPQKQMPQVFMGTGGMGYLPPEQLAAKKEFGPESDLYMLGLILFEMLTGSLPGRRSPLPSAANSAVPAKLDPLFDRMTQDKREARYPDVDALLDDFYAAFSDGRFLHKGDLVLFAAAPDKPDKPGDKPGESAGETEADKSEGSGKGRRASPA
jgi:serine/threonine protein kinase